MEIRKNRRYDLERNRPIFIEIGLIVALLAAIAVFNISGGRPPAPVFRQVWQPERQIAEINVIPEHEPEPAAPDPEPASIPPGGGVNIVAPPGPAPSGPEPSEPAPAVSDAAPGMADTGPGFSLGPVGNGGTQGAGTGEGGGGAETVIGRVRNNKDEVIAIVYFRITPDKMAEFERDRRRIIRRLERGRYPGATPENPTVITLEINRLDW